MEKYTKHIVLVALLALFFNATAQEVHKKTNKVRTTQAQALDKEIEAFISENFHRYNLTPGKEADIRKRFENTNSKSYSSVTKALEDAKRNELRKLYFKQNPEAEQIYSSSANDSIRYICENGGLEDGYDDDYSFTNKTITPPFSCNIDVSLFLPVSLSSTINDFNAKVTLVNDDASVSGGFDPTLNALSTPINITRVNSGNTAIKINNDIVGAQEEITTMKKLFNKTGDNISYSYSYIAEYLLNSFNPGVQSHFIVRLYRENGDLLSQNCIVADPNNPLFTSVSYGPNATHSLLYTNWQCGVISAQGVPYGELLRLEFIVTDAGKRTYGTVYIDDICDDGSCVPSTGYVELLLDDVLVNCPAFPVTVCGVYSLPFTTNTNPVITGGIDSLILNIYQNNVVVGTVSNYQLNGNQFCFTLSASDFGTTPVSGEFEFEAILQSSILNYTYTIIDESARIGPDAVFINCTDDCPPYLVITTQVTTGNTDTQQAGVQIIASNIIDANASALYHARQEIILQPGFEALLNSEDRFYIEGCRDDNQYYERKPADVAETGNSNVIRKEMQIDLVEAKGAQLQNTVTLYPNPAKTSINITAGNTGIKSVRITSLDGKQIENLNFNTGMQNVYTIDISGISKGIYILTTETLDGQIISHKVIKE